MKSQFHEDYMSKPRYRIYWAGTQPGGESLAVFIYKIGAMPGTLGYREFYEKYYRWRTGVSIDASGRVTEEMPLEPDYFFWQNPNNIIS